jgi:hypothetical protein
MICSGECRRRLDDPIAPIVLLAHAWAVRLSKRPDRPHGVTPSSLTVMLGCGPCVARESGW